MSLRTALIFGVFATASACKPPGSDGGVKSLSDITDNANGAATALRSCAGPYRAFGGVRPDEAAFVNFADAERLAFNKAATAVPGFALYFYSMVLGGQFVVDPSLAACQRSSGRAPQGPCAVFNTEAGEHGSYKVVFERGAEKIASHLPFAAGLMMIDVARYQVVDGKPVFTDLPPDVKSALEEVKRLYLSEAKFDLSKPETAGEIAYLKDMPLDFFAANALDSALCSADLVAKDTALYPQTMAKMQETIKGFAAVETAFAAALKAGTPLQIPSGLSPFAQRLAENLKASAAFGGPSADGKGLGLWGRGGLGGGGKVAVGEGPFGRTVFENPVRASGRGFLNSKADRPWVDSE